MPAIEIRNLTPHPVMLMDASGAILNTFPTSGRVVRLEYRVELEDQLHLEGVVVPTVDLVECGIDALPDPEPGVMFIVSRPIAQRVHRPDLLVTHQEVRDEATNTIIGCRGLARIL